MKTFVSFHKGVMQYHPTVKVWLGLLMILNLIIPLVLLQHRVAVLVLIALGLNMVVMMALTARCGFSRILGLGHVFWIPLSVYLFSRWPDFPIGSFSGIWLRLLTLINLASLVIDTLDVIRYSKGDSL